jgi:hypothetical protein
MRSRPAWRPRFIEAAVARRKLNNRTWERVKRQVAKGGAAFIQMVVRLLCATFGIRVFSPAMPIDCFRT